MNTEREGGEDCSRSHCERKISTVQFQILLIASTVRAANIEPSRKSASSFIDTQKIPELEDSSLNFAQ